MPAGGLGVEQITKNRQRFLHDGGKVHNSGHRGRLLSTTSTCGIMDGPSILRGATDFAKLQIKYTREFLAGDTVGLRGAHLWHENLISLHSAIHVFMYCAIHE